ncbi:MAG: helix-turn-helix domain-containing protein [Oscillospiraceae bacterium]|nr:helix-turn-helix domain-containing protein [Oscillospiraceae bacterium]
MTLGERIKRQRNKLGYSQEKIAELVGTSRQAVTKWESGQSVPCMENLMALAEIFGIPLNELSSGIHEEGLREDGNGTSTQDVRKRPLLIWDATAGIAVVFAVWGVLRMPALIGYSYMGYFSILLQIAAVLYIPIYLFLIRPRQKKHIPAKAPAGKAVLLNRVYWAFGAMAVLCGCYTLCGYAAYELHGNRDWSLVLFVFGLLVIGAAVCFNALKVMVCAVAGYTAGCAAGLLFNRDYAGPGDYGGAMSYSNWWIIWTVVFLAVIAAGLVWEILSRVCGNKSGAAV